MPDDPEAQLFEQFARIGRVLASTRRDGQRIYCRLASPAVGDLLRSLQNAP